MVHSSGLASAWEAPFRTAWQIYPRPSLQAQCVGLLCKGLYKTNCSNGNFLFPPSHLCSRGWYWWSPTFPSTHTPLLHPTSIFSSAGSLEGWGSLLRTISVAPDSTAPSLLVNSFSPGSPPNSRLLLSPLLSVSRHPPANRQVPAAWPGGSFVPSPHSRHTAPTRTTGGTVARRSGVTIPISGSDLFNQLLPNLSPLMSQRRLKVYKLQSDSLLFSSQVRLPQPSVGISVDALRSRWDTTLRSSSVSPPSHCSAF